MDATISLTATWPASISTMTREEIEQLFDDRRKKVAEALVLSVEAAAAFYKLTDKERYVLSLMLDGHSNADTAVFARNTEKTVKHTISAIFSKMKVSSRAEAFARVAGRM